MVSGDLPPLGRQQLGTANLRIVGFFETRKKNTKDNNFTNLENLNKIWIFATFGTATPLEPRSGTGSAALVPCGVCGPWLFAALADSEARDIQACLQAFGQL